MASASGSSQRDATQRKRVANPGDHNPRREKLQKAELLDELSNVRARIGRGPLPQAEVVWQRVFAAEISFSWPVQLRDVELVPKEKKNVARTLAHEDRYGIDMSVASAKNENIDDVKASLHSEATQIDIRNMFFIMESRGWRAGGCSKPHDLPRCISCLKAGVDKVMDIVDSADLSRGDVSEKIVYTYQVVEQYQDFDPSDSESEFVGIEEDRDCTVEVRIVSYLEKKLVITMR
jgi:hypothetical protein